MRQSILLLVVSVCACTSWRTAELSPQTFVGPEHPTRVRVTRTDGAVVVLRNPSIRADTLYGTQLGNSALAIPLTEVRRLVVPRGDILKSLGLLVLVGAVAAGAILLIAISGYSGD